MWSNPQVPHVPLDTNHHFTIFIAKVKSVVPQQEENKSRGHYKTLCIPEREGNSFKQLKESNTPNNKQTLNGGLSSELSPSWPNLDRQVIWIREQDRAASQPRSLNTAGITIIKYCWNYQLTSCPCSCSQLQVSGTGARPLEAKPRIRKETILFWTAKATFIECKYNISKDQPKSSSNLLTKQEPKGQRSTMALQSSCPSPGINLWQGFQYQNGEDPVTCSKRSPQTILLSGSFLYARNTSC